MNYTVYKIDLKGKKSNRENLNDNELDKWMDKVHGKFANIRVERSDGNWIEYTDDGTKFVVKKKGKGINERKIMKFKDYLTEMNKKQLAMLAGKVGEQDKAASKLKKGDKVKHWKLGPGEIINIKKSSHAGQVLVSVKFDSGTKEIDRPAHEFEAI